MQIKFATLETCAGSTGLVVVIDVLRAFTTAAYAFAAGASEILLAGTIEEAFELRRRFPESLIMGESDGLKITGFDFSNSPAELRRQLLLGRRLIQRTSAGTQGVVRSQQAQTIFAASFVVARATARAILNLNPASTTFVITGLESGNQYHGVTHSASTFGDEDSACAEYIESLLLGKSPEPGAYIQRVIDSAPGRIFSDPSRPEFPPSDLDLSLKLDCFDFALQVSRQDGLFIMNKTRSSDENIII